MEFGAPIEDGLSMDKPPKAQVPTPTLLHTPSSCTNTLITCPNPSPNPSPCPCLNTANTLSTCHNNNTALALILTLDTNPNSEQ